jgi:hypothetical protein
MQEQIDLLDPKPQETVRAFLDDQQLPEPVDKVFVKALNDVFNRFTVKTISRAELWGALFPESAPSTVTSLHTWPSMASGTTRWQRCAGCSSSGRDPR